MSSERALQRQVAAYLAAVLDPAQVVYFHPMNEGKRGLFAQADFKLGGGLAGVPDWMLSWGCRSLTYKVIPYVAWFELKAAKGKLSPAQEAFRERVAVIGHHWLLARDLAAVAAALRLWDVPMRPHKIWGENTVMLSARAVSEA